MEYVVTRICLLALLVLGCWAVVEADGAQRPTDLSYALELSPATPQVQALSNRVCRVVRSAGFPVGPCPQVWVARELEHLDGVPSGVAAAASPAGTLVTPAWNVPPVGLLGACPEQDVMVHAHELLHRLHAARVAYVTADGRPVPHAWLWTDEDRWWEEAAVEAVTRDLLPILTRKLCKAAPWPEQLDAYPRRVQAIRAVSARATRSSWRSRAARSWRAWFVRQPVETRRAALAAAFTR